MQINWKIRKTKIKKHRQNSVSELSIRQFFLKMDKGAKLTASSIKGNQHNTSSSEDSMKRFFLKMDFYVETTTFLVKQHEMCHQYRIIFKSLSCGMSVPPVDGTNRNRLRESATH